MRFRRRPKLEAFDWTARKLSAFARRPEKQRAKIREAYPLLSVQLESEIQPLRSPADEAIARQASLLAGERSMRDLQAKHWRSARRSYFACSDQQRAAIRAEWRRWPGPAEASNFSYVVEKHNGVQQARAEQRRSEAMAVALSLANEAQQSALPLIVEVPHG